MQAKYHNPETGTHNTKEEALNMQIIDPIVEKTEPTKTVVKPTKGGKE